MIHDIITIVGICYDLTTKYDKIQMLELEQYEYASLLD